MNDKEMRQRAHAEVARAIRIGELPRPDTVPCTDCGREYTSGGPRHEYDHYSGYTREHRLSVQSVCKTCHIKRTVSRPDWKERKPSSGRPPIPGGIERITTTIKAGYKEKLATIGRGSVSAGIERLVDEYEDRQNRRRVNRLADIQTDGH